MPLEFPIPYDHNHPPVENVNQVFDEKMTFGQRSADFIAKIVGSWTFIIIQSCILISWATLNAVAWASHWDPYPFILMNLFLSLQAAYTAPMLMMSQNRQAMKDRVEAHYDYLINQKAEDEIRIIMDHLVAQDNAIKELHRLLVEMKETRTKIE